MLCNAATVNDVEFRDVVPISIGMSVAGGRNSIVIYKNKPLPCTQSKYFYAKSAHA